MAGEPLTDETWRDDQIRAMILTLEHEAKRDRRRGQFASALRFLLARAEAAEREDARHVADAAHYIERLEAEFVAALASARAAAREEGRQAGLKEAEEAARAKAAMLWSVGIGAFAEGAERAAEAVAALHSPTPEEASHAPDA